MSRVAIITGGTWGIGRTLVATFAQEGYRVYLIDIDSQGATHYAQELCQRGHAVFAYGGDIAQRETIEAFVTYVLEREQGVDVLINNACTTRRGIESGCDYDNFLYVQQVGVVAPYMLAKLLKSHFNVAASVVNISSSRAFQSQADTESYSAAKGGITALTHALAISLSGIARVNAIAPGWIETGVQQPIPTLPNHTPSDTAQHPSQRVGTPDDIARAALFLCHPDNSFINGETLLVDGGMSKLMVYHGDNGWTYRV